MAQNLFRSHSTKSKRPWLGLVLALGLCAGGSAAALPGRGVPSAGAGASKALDLVEGVHSYALANGLQLLLVPEASQPKVTVRVVYKVGSRHEGAGETGMAHLLEHILFRGSRRHRDMLAELAQHGAESNAETDVDATAYYETLLSTPENLQFALDLEADRMTGARLDPQDLGKEAAIVRNELEIGENSPATILEQRLLRTAYTWHAYGRDVIGTKSDIEAVPIERLRAFYQHYYQPDNAVLIVAGKFEREPTLRLVASLFGRLGRPARRLVPTYTVEPVQDGERAVTLRRAGDVQMVGLVYHALPAVHPDFAAAQAAADVLTHEGSGRAYRALVESRLGTNLRAVAYANAEPGTVAFYIDVPKTQPIEPVRDILIAQVEELGSRPLTMVEVRRFQARARREFVRTSADPEALAEDLGRWAAAGDWRLRYLHRDRIEQLTPEEVQSFAQRYFVAANRTAGLFLPTGQPSRSPLPATPDAAALLQGYKGRPPPSPGETFGATIDNIEARAQRLKLANGLKVALLPKRSRGESVYIALHVNAGTKEALAGKAELPSLLGPLLGRGTKRRSFLQLSDEFDRLGAEVQLPALDTARLAGQGDRIEIETTRAHLGEMLALLAELLQEPSFPKQQLELVRKELVTAVEGALADPAQRAVTALLRRIYAFPVSDPRYVPTLPERITRLEQIQVEELQKFHREHWGGAAAELALVGDFDAGQVATSLEALFGAWRAPRSYERLPFPYVENASGEETISLGDKQNAVVLAGQSLELGDQDPDAPALALFAFLLGGSDNARLKLRLREQTGTSYEVTANVYASAHEQSGLFYTYFTAAPPQARDALKLLEDELVALVTHGPSAAELRASQQAYRKAYETDLANDRVLARQLMVRLERDRTLRFDKERLDRITALSLPDFLAAVRRHIAPKRLIKILAGDLS